MARDVYTADMGQPPSPDEGPTAEAPAPRRILRRPVKRPVRDVYTAEMGQPPSPDEGPTATSPRSMPRPTSGTRPFAKGGSVGSASRRADGIATKGKTKGRMC